MKKAAMAVAHRILIIAWHIIHDGGVYREAGSSHYDRLHPDRSARRLTRRLQQLGFEVTLKPQMSLGTSPKPDSPQPAMPLKPPAADPKLCRRCARWGIPCIHIRNQRLTNTTPPANVISTT
jgi:hypothetical protein